MATPNFASPKNASKYFVVLTNIEEKYKECEECLHRHYEWEYDLDELNECENECENPTFEIGCETRAPETHECDDLMLNIESEITSLEHGFTDDTKFHDRNYQRASLGALNVSKTFGDITVELKLTSILQSAYYEGATLDYMLEVYNGGEMIEPYDTCSLEDIVIDLFDLNYNEHDYSEMSKGLRTIQCRNAFNWIEEQVSLLGEQLEKIYERFSSHKLQCDGVFSNGEAVYSKAS